MGPSADFDVVIAGGGHNGLICGCVLAKNGLKVNVVERNPWVGGGVVTREVTLPGFKHDLFGSSHVWIHLNPDCKDIKPDLEKHGLKYIWSDDHITGHPNKYEGEGIIVYKDVDKTCDTIAAYSKSDAKRYREIYEKFGEIQGGVTKAMFAPLAPPSFLYQGLENNPQGMTRLRDYQLSSRQFTLDNFENDHVRAFILGWAMARANLCFHRGVTTGGERTLAQLGAFRPFPNYADYRGPVKKFYMTGPSCHPGGGMSGMGTIAANEILLDLGIREEDDDFYF